MSSIELLISRFPPPAVVAESFAKNTYWQAIEAKLGIALPSDYKTVVAKYGSGAFDDFLWVLNPFSSNDNLNLIKQSSVRLASQREFAEYSGVPNPYPLYPDANGIFPWGVTDNGDVLYWLCEGIPAAWTVVLCDSTSTIWRDFPLSTTEFLCSVLEKRVIVDVFPSDFPSIIPRFFAHSAIP